MQDLTLSQLIKEKKKFNRIIDSFIVTELITHINKIELVIEYYKGLSGVDDDLVDGASESLKALHKYLVIKNK